ncbi:MAG: GNAT family N-acetyltransferase [Chloroflexota bacterium]|nr:GNAT family N-acetyltransferase [Chloroflexota bacterium]
MTTTPGSSTAPAAGAVPDIPDRVRAMFANQAEWLVRYAAARDGAINSNRVWRNGDLIAAITSSTGVLIHRQDQDAAAVRLDVALSWLKTQGSGDVLVWSATRRPSLDLPLASRGCGDGFVPLWMWCDLALMNAETPTLGDIEISLATSDDRRAMRAVSGVPNLGPDNLPVMLDLAEAPGTTGAVWLLLARNRRQIIGGGAINLTGEGQGIVAGLYNLGVRPDMQGRGIGTALTLALCRIASARGAVGIALNATPAGEKVYRKVGFVETGCGQTWFLPADRLRSLPDPATIRQAKALGSGAIDALDPSLARTLQMSNCETPLTFAARFGRRESVQWLIANGAEPDILALWKVGLRDEAIAAMRDACYLNARGGPGQVTPLHEAVRDDDPELVRLLVDAGADLSIEDGQYRSTPLGWAKALGRPHLARILEAKAARP